MRSICSGNGWKLRQDSAAQWKNDDLYLPPVDLAKIPTNPPTGGWQVLETGKDGKSRERRKNRQKNTGAGG